MRLDRSEILCRRVLSKCKRDRESIWHRHQKGAESAPLASYQGLIYFFSWLLTIEWSYQTHCHHIHLKIIGLTVVLEWGAIAFSEKGLTRPQRRCPFRRNGLECESRKSRDNWSNRQVWPWDAEWSRAEANSVLPEELTGHCKHPHATTQEKTTHEHHQMVNIKIRLIIFFAVKDGEALVSKNKTSSWLWLRSWTPYCQIQT